MGAFLENEKARQVEFKSNSLYFSNAARNNGIYKGKARPFCLPVEHAEENLFLDIRQKATDYFKSQKIKWHDGHGNNPSNHLCDSQVCCVNFLFPFANQPRALAEVLRFVFPDIQEMIQIENEQYVAFEWIGKENYLHEKTKANSERTRGANFTSADAVVLFKQKDGKRHGVLIEWKYTESYGRTFLKISGSSE